MVIVNLGRGHPDEMNWSLGWCELDIRKTHFGHQGGVSWSSGWGNLIIWMGLIGHQSVNRKGRVVHQDGTMMVNWMGQDGHLDGAIWSSKNWRVHLRGTTWSLGWSELVIKVGRTGYQDRGRLLLGWGKLAIKTRQDVQQEGSSWSSG